MIFYQASAIAEKRLSPSDYGAARWDTIVGAILTQLVTASVLVAIAALKPHGQGASLDNIGQISEVLTPLLGEVTGRLVFSAGVVGARSRFDKDGSTVLTEPPWLWALH